MRKELALLAAAAALFTFLAFSAQAVPVASLKGGAKSVDQVTPWPEVAAGWHRGPYGHCRR